MNLIMIERKKKKKKKKEKEKKKKIIEEVAPEIDEKEIKRLIFYKSNFINNKTILKTKSN